MAIKNRAAFVIGAGGFIGYNLCLRLKKEGWYVTGLDLKVPLYGENVCDEFILDDATTHNFDFAGFDRIYQLAADMGGAGFVFTGDNDAEILTNSLGINLNVLKHTKNYQGTIFYSSSVCGYPDGAEGKEQDAYPANPPSDYGWEKLTSERLYLAYAKNHGLDTRIARFHNTFGPYGTYDGGREKAPAAICRKVVLTDDGGEIEIWGDGEQLRPFIYIDDLLDGIEALMQSKLSTPVNLGPSEGITINDLVDLVSKIAGKKLVKKHIPGPTGGQVRNANNELARLALNWEPAYPLETALAKTYDWIKEQL